MRVLIILTLLIGGLGYARAQSDTSVTKLKTGCLGGNCKTGRGNYRYTNGDWYIGNFKDGFRNGDGILVKANGDSINGYFRMDTIRGDVKYYYKNGDVYRGTITPNGIREGKGELLTTDSNRYYGEFKDNVPNGMGMQQRNNGQISRGEFKSGRLIREEPYKFAQDSTGDGEFCMAFRELLKSMPGRFNSVKGNTFQGDKGKQWSPKYVIPGATRAYIFNPDTIMSQAYFELVRSATQAEAQAAYESVRRKIKICKPFEFVIKQDEAFTSEDNMLLFVTGNKRPKNSTAPGYTTELSCQQVDGSYTVILKLIAYDK